QTIMSNSIPTPPPQPPLILQQSLGSNAFVGDTVTFSVEAAGAAPLSYQWSKNSQPISPSSNPTATNSSLTLSNISAAAAGSYVVVITNVAGAITSSVIPLTVGSFTPATNGEILRMDVDLSGSPNTQPGWQTFTLAGNGAVFGNAVQVTLSGL